VALGSSGVVAALTDVKIFLFWCSSVSGFGWFSTTVALGGGGGIIKEDISSDVKTLACFSSGLPLVNGGGGIVIVAKKDSRSRFIRLVLFLNPLSNTESMENHNFLTKEGYF
jgi:hypothetical protein